MPLGNALHRRMMREFRLYMIVGGMPQAVESYLKTNNMSKVDMVKRDIIALYETDFNKIDEHERASAMFNAIPAQLNKNFSRFQVSSVVEGERSGRIFSTIKAMSDTMTVNVAYHSNDPNVGLALTRDNERFKMYMCDTGLFITLAFKDDDVANNIIYEKILNDKLSTNLGYVYENMIAQMLRTTGKQLYYHTMPTENKKYYEIDFLIADGHKISPIEVKSSGYKTHASLDAFCRKYSDRIRHKYLIYTKDLQRIEDVDYIPVYMTMFL
jgi:predicted AAA+ superfamily ATPase